MNKCECVCVCVCVCVMRLLLGAEKSFVYLVSSGEQAGDRESEVSVRREVQVSHLTPVSPPLTHRHHYTPLTHLLTHLSLSLSLSLSLALTLSSATAVCHGRVCPPEDEESREIGDSRGVWSVLTSSHPPPAPTFTHLRGHS